MDLSKLKHAYQHNVCMAAVCDYFAPRPGVKNPTDHKQTEVERIYSTLSRSSVPVEKKEIFAVLREFEKYGFGKLVIGRKGYESRFIWDIPSTSLASIARGEQQPEEEETEEDETEEDEGDEDTDEEEETSVVSSRLPSTDTSQRQIAARGGKVVKDTAPPVMESGHRRVHRGASYRTELLIPHSFSLREDVTVSFWLPADFKRAEAVMLIAFICTIACTD